MIDSKLALLPSFYDSILSSLKNLQPEANDTAEVLKMKQKYLQTILDLAKAYSKDISNGRVRLVHQEEWER